MKTIKTNELTGAALDWTTAKCEGRAWELVDSFIDYYEEGEMNYSTDWAHGGPIIERERLNIVPTSVGWEAYPDHGMSNELFEVGLTPLIAAIRCYVASRLGDTVEVPEELL